jgi:hypothetical protein
MARPHRAAPAHRAMVPTVVIAARIAAQIAARIAVMVRRPPLRPIEARMEAVARAAVPMAAAVEEQDMAMRLAAADRSARRAIGTAQRTRIH